MKKTYEELCGALEGEEIELNIKLEHLEHFMMSEDFQEISERQKELLTRQLEAMRMYKGALIARVMQARFEHNQKPGDTCAPEPKEEETDKDNLCSTCRYGAECPDGPRCKKCDNGSKWMGPEKPQDHAQPSDCPKCRWGERQIEGDHIYYTCRNTNKKVSRDKCFEARKY